MAPPTRLTEPERTSPTAKTPGTLGAQRAERLAVRAIRAGDDEAGLVDLDAAAREPAGRRVGADEEEDIADRAFGFLAGLAVAPAHCLQPASGRLPGRTISVWVISSIFGVAAIRSIR